MSLCYLANNHIIIISFLGPGVIVDQFCKTRTLTPSPSAASYICNTRTPSLRNQVIIILIILSWILPCPVIIINILSDYNYVLVIIYIVQQTVLFIIADKNNLFESTKEIGYWFGLCTSLRVSEAIMNDLKETAGKNSHKRQECLTSYFYNYRPLWNEVVQVIAESMNETCLQKLAKKHMKWEEKDCELAYNNSP